MSTPLSRKRTADIGPHDERASLAQPAIKRQRSRSPSATGHFPLLESNTSTEQDRRPSVFELDSPGHHVRLQDLGNDLLKAAKATAGTLRAPLNDISEYPRLLFGVKVSDDLETIGSQDVFGDLLGKFPNMSNFFRIEAGFASDSTLVMISIYPGLLEYFPGNPAMTLVGSIKSRNFISSLPPNRIQETGAPASGSPVLEKEDDSKGKMKPPAISAPKIEEPSLPKGGCRYIMFREDVRPMACQCQGFSQDISASRAICDCGHKPCYHLATRAQTVYRQELESLTKKVYKLEQDLRRTTTRSGGFTERTLSSEEREMVAFRGGMYMSERPPSLHKTIGNHFQSQPGIPGPESWNFRGH